MKKTVFIKIISLALVLIMTIACFAACGDSENSEESSDVESSESVTTVTDSATSDTESATTDTESDDTEPDDDDYTVDEILPIFSNGKTQYTIVTTDAVNADIAVATNELKCLLATFANTSINIKSVSDFKFLYGEKLRAPKIIIGSLIEDADSVDMRYELDSGEFIIKFSQNTLYITGKSNADTLRAWEYFKITYLYKGMTELAFEDGFCYESKSEQVEDVTVNGTPLSEFKIVHCNSFYAKKYAESIRSLIYRKTGITLGLVTDTSDESDHEILVGKTNREESNAVRSEYDRPNLYYDVKTVGSKLVIMGEGYKTLEHVAAEFDKYLNSLTEPTDINGTVINGNVRDFVDPTPMIDRAEGTDLRILHYNLAAPLFWDENAIYKNDTERGEAIADMILAYFPDIITTDEVYKGRTSSYHDELYDAVLGELSEYYYILDDSPYDDGKPFEDSVGNLNYGINENILHKKALDLEVISSSWRYGSITNDNGDIYAHLGFHTATFKSPDGTRFIVSAGHYGDSGTDTTWAKEHQQAIADAQAASGSDEALPTIMTGDMFTTKGRAGYNYHLNAGYSDAQQSAPVNCNLSVRGDVLRNHTTFHTVGIRQISRAAEDFVWYTAELEALQFKVIASELTDRTSDHYPVCADLKFK